MLIKNPASRMTLRKKKKKFRFDSLRWKYLNPFELPQNGHQRLPTNYLSVFDHFTWLALKGLLLDSKLFSTTFSAIPLRMFDTNLQKRAKQTFNGTFNS